MTKFHFSEVLAWAVTDIYMGSQSAGVVKMPFRMMDVAAVGQNEKP